jgi:hypothetical protein
VARRPRSPPQGTAVATSLENMRGTLDEQFEVLLDASV